MELRLSYIWNLPNTSSISCFAPSKYGQAYPHNRTEPGEDGNGDRRRWRPHRRESWNPRWVRAPGAESVRSQSLTRGPESHEKKRANSSLFFIFSKEKRTAVGVCSFRAASVPSSFDTGLLLVNAWTMMLWSPWSPISSKLPTGLPWRSSLQVADSFVQDGRKYGTTNSLAVILSGSCWIIAW